MKENDIIISVNGVRISSAADVSAVMNKHGVLHIIVRRGNEDVPLTVVPTEIDPWPLWFSGLRSIGDGLLMIDRVKLRLKMHVDGDLLVLFILFNSFIKVLNLNIINVYSLQNKPLVTLVTIVCVVFFTLNKINGILIK